MQPICEKEPPFHNESGCVAMSERYQVRSDARSPSLLSLLALLFYCSCRLTSEVKQERWPAPSCVGPRTTYRLSFGVDLGALRFSICAQ